MQGSASDEEEANLLGERPAPSSLGDICRHGVGSAYQLDSHGPCVERFPSNDVRSDVVGERASELIDAEMCEAGGGHMEISS